MTVLYRLNNEQNMRRFYRLDVQRDLFGQWCCVREWGRIGRAGRYSISSFNTKPEAEKFAGKVFRSKAEKGYQPVF